MAIDAKAAAINVAAVEVKQIAVQLGVLSGKIITPLAVNDDDPDNPVNITLHPDTVVSMKARAVKLKAEWEEKRNALDAAFLVI